MVEIDCIIVLSIPSCKVEYVDKISRRKCILLNLYCYKWILLTGKYVLDAIYFIREVNFNYFLTLPQIHSPTPFFNLFKRNALYDMVYWINIIRMEKNIQYVNLLIWWRVYFYEVKMKWKCWAFLRIWGTLF